MSYPITYVPSAAKAIRKLDRSTARRLLDAIDSLASDPRPSGCIQLKKIYTAPTEQTALAALAEFEASELGEKYPQSVKVWRDAWDRFIPFLEFPPMARKVIYTTNSIESMNNELRKATRNRVQFTNDESAIKTLWLMICNIEDKRAAKRAKQVKRVAATSGRLIEGRRVTNWKQAINQMSVAYPDRFEPYL